MDEFLMCSMNCQNKANYSCKCTDRKNIFCLNHFLIHTSSEGNHQLIKIMIDPDLQTKEIISNFLRDIKLQVKKEKHKIIQESILLINQIKDIAQNSLERLTDIEKKIDDYMILCYSLNQVNNLNSQSFIESALKLKAEDALKIKYYDDILNVNKENIKEKLDNLFTTKEAKDIFDNDNYEVLNPIRKPVIKYFKGKNLFAVDIVSLTSNGQSISKNFIQWDPTCLLANGSIFCCFPNETFIVTNKNTIIPLDSTKYSNYSGLVAVDDCVYMFGGAKDISARFSLKLKNWTTLAQYPISCNTYVSCAFFNENILIVGWSSEILSCYNILNDSFTNNQAIVLNAQIGKTCLAGNNKAYIIVYSASSYESGLNSIDEWTKIGSVGMLEHNYPRHSYPLLYDESFYFISCNYKLIQFNLKDKSLRHQTTL